MKLFGKIISVIARLVLRNTWHRLEKDLDLLYIKYLTSVRTKIPPIVIATLITAEDHRFFQHAGIDPIAIARAIWRFVVRGALEGASTIEQQFVRTFTGRYGRSLGRKLREILLASLVQRAIPKSEIPGVYLSIAYFGWKMNGIKQAADRLQIDLNSTTTRQAASLVARLKYPEPKMPTPKRYRQISVRTEYLTRLVSKQESSFYPIKTEVVNETVLDF